MRIDLEGSEAVATIRYRGDDRELTLRSRWQDRAPHPVIVHVEPVN